MRRWILFLVGWLLALSAQAETIRVAVAANFNAPLLALVAEFEQQHTDVDVRISSGSSGKLFAQIVNGAPFDVFLSADRDKPARLAEQGLAAEVNTYAIGQLALWSAADNIDVLARLKQGDFARLAIANPKLAPYGLAAQQTLLALHLPADVMTAARQRQVMGENVSQVYQFIATGNADLGFVALSHIQQANLTPAQWPGSVWLVPDVLHQPIRQDLALLKRSGQSQQQRLAAQQLRNFLLSPQAQPILQRFGYRAHHAD